MIQPSVLRRAVILIVSSSALLAAQEKPTCGDFLEQLHAKPQYLEFVECKPNLRDEQTKPLVAHYQVKGIHAAAVERALHNSFAMSRMKRICCIWESPERAFHSKDGHIYYLSMGSGETLLYKRSDWGKIPYFYVDFSLQTQEP